MNERRPKEKSKTEKVLCLWMYTQLGNRKTEKYNKLKEVIRNSSAHSNASEYNNNNTDIFDDKVQSSHRDI